MECNNGKRKIALSSITYPFFNFEGRVSLSTGNILRKDFTLLSQTEGDRRN